MSVPEGRETQAEAARDITRNTKVTFEHREPMAQSYHPSTGPPAVHENRSMMASVHSGLQVQGLQSRPKV